ncbi:G-box-binding factor 4-like [Andrographis paniculata]|uniref:G-box-binding factor 4-like n=1 Tax=Andrographis paniculata TaxID=175694 RepID=UPI0021E8F30C|nr:G-box-binding factor 4-like [Andrographis paniculata]
MASSKLMASRNSEINRKGSGCNSTADFLRLDSGGGGSNAPDNLASDSVMAEGFLRNEYVEGKLNRDRGRRQVVESESDSGTRLNAEAGLLDSVGGSTTNSDGERPEPPRAVRKTVDDVWREIVAGKKTAHKPKEEMMTLEDFLAKAGATEEEEEEEEEEEATPKKRFVDVKEEGFSGGFSVYKSNSVIAGSVASVGMDVGGLGGGRGKRSLSLLEPLDKAALQRQRRMIKNRESAARSRERKQAYQVELETMAVRLEEENDRLLKEKEERRKKRLKQLLKNVIPVTEKQRPPRRHLRRVRSMQW